MKLRRFLGALALTGMIVGCTSAPFSAPETSPITPEGASGCGAQVLSVEEVPFGALEVRVEDEKGAPVSGQLVMAYRQVYTGTKCASRIEGTTDAQGLVKFERLKTGPFGVSIPGMSKQYRTEVLQNQTANLTVVIAKLESPQPMP